MTVEFTMDDLAQDRGVKVSTENDNQTLLLQVGFIDSHAGYAYLTKDQALALAGTIRAMANQLER